MNLQDNFLNQARVKKMAVTIFLISGHQMKGTIAGFDHFVIELKSGENQNIVYKHAISTIVPASSITLLKNDIDGGRQDEHD